MNPIDPISAFGGKTISYTYDNGWSFTNTFNGHLRTSQVPRGLLQEHVEMVQLPVFGGDGVTGIHLLEVHLLADPTVGAAPIVRHR